MAMYPPKSSDALVDAICGSPDALTAQRYEQQKFTFEKWWHATNGSHTHAPKIGDEWFVKLPGNYHLTLRMITRVNVDTVTFWAHRGNIEVVDRPSVYATKDVEFVEKHSPEDIAYAVSLLKEIR